LEPMGDVCAFWLIVSLFGWPKRGKIPQCGREEAFRGVQYPKRGKIPQCGREEAFRGVQYPKRRQ
jgi:hypothetical protein